MTYQPKNYSKQGGAEWVVGGSLSVSTSGTLDVNGTFNAESATFGGTLSVSSSGTLSVAGAFNADSATFSGTLSSSGTLDVSGTFNADSLTIDGPLTIGSGGHLIDTDGKWEDLRFPSASVRVPGSGGPGTSAVIGTIHTLAFDADSAESVYLQAQMPHSWKKGSTLSPHVHYCTTATTAGKVVWGMEYSIAELNANFTAATTAKVVATASTQHKLASFADIDMSSYTGPSTMMLIRLYRDATNSSDTHTVDAHLLEFDIHYLVNSLGSSGAAAQGP